MSQGEKTEDQSQRRSAGGYLIACIRDNSSARETGEQELQLAEDVIELGSNAQSSPLLALQVQQVL